MAQKDKANGFMYSFKLEFKGNIVVENNLKQKKYLITSALPYINGIKHLGNLIGSMLPADVYARYLRQRGEIVLYICGTDDHGAPAEIAAKDAGISVELYCSKMHDIQKKIYEDFNISFDYFGRTSSQSNCKITQEIFKQLDKNGYITERVIKQYYSKEDKCFLPDRFIIGTCPHCGYDKARGDQCDGCSSLLDPTDLISPKSSLNKNSALELKETTHLFLNLPKLKHRVENWTKNLQQPSKLVSGILKKWLDEGLHERCITRDLAWGVPVPKVGFEEKVFYVWFDAPNAYISMTMDVLNQDGSIGNWEEWWKNADNVEYSQFMAKDNVAFHGIFWPAVLLGTAENWTMVNNLKGFNWLTYESGKFSTSQKRGVFTDQALKLFPADYWRYYLLANAPESSDADFDFKNFILTSNADLSDKLGNFVSRVLALIEKYFDAKIPSASISDNSIEALKQQVYTICIELNNAYKDLRYRDIIKNIRHLWMVGNEYITLQQPWLIIKENKPLAGSVLLNCLYLIRIYAITIYPVIPGTANKLWDILKLDGSPENYSIQDAVNFTCLKANSIISNKVTLFEKIDLSVEKDLQEQFSGE